MAYATDPGNYSITDPVPGPDAVDVTVSGTQFTGALEEVRVDISRSEGTVAGAVPTFFARIWGIEEVDVGAVAVARRNRRVIGTGPGNLLPFGIHINMIALHPDDDDDDDGGGGGAPNHDREYDIGLSVDIYPQSYSPGNFGILDLDGGSNSNAETAYWIENGYDGIFIIPETGINVEGDPGISGGSLNGAINLRLGDTVLFPVFDQVTEQGANTIYRVVDLVGGIITGFQLTGAVSSRHLTVEIVEFTAQNIVVGGDDVALNNSVSAPVLIQ